MGRLGYFVLGTLLGVAGTITTAYFVARSSESDPILENTADVNADDFDDSMEADSSMNSMGHEEPTMA